MIRPAGRTAPSPWLVPVTAAAIVAVDQLTKWWALEALADGPVDLVGSLRLRLVFNTGGAFSLGRGMAPVLAVVALVLVVVLARMGRLASRPLPAVAIGAVLGGALGNLADRLFRQGDGFLGGAVVDFVDLQWWPVFNVADIAIVVGALLVLLTAGRDERPEDG